MVIGKLVAEGSDCIHISPCLATSNLLFRIVPHSGFEIHDAPTFPKYLLTDSQILCLGIVRLHHGAQSILRPFSSRVYDIFLCKPKSLLLDISMVEYWAILMMPGCYQGDYSPLSVCN